MPASTSDVERLAVVGHRDGRFVVLAAGRDRKDRVAPADAGELEGAPVQIGVELVGDRDGLGGGGGGGGVLEVDLVGEDVPASATKLEEP